MSEPEGSEAISKRLDRIEQQLERLTNTLDEAMPAIGMMVDAGDEIAADLQSRGVDLDGSARDLLAIVERLSEPATLGALREVVDALPRLVPVVELATTFRDTTGMVFDMADEQVESLRKRGIDVESRLGQVLDLLARLTDPEVHEHLLQLADAAPNLLAATQTGELFGRAMDDVSQSPRRSIGLWGLMSAMGDPKVQRAAGFAVEVARRVGERLPDGSSRALTRTVPTAK